jgi:hypothetical protein
MNMEKRYFVMTSNGKPPPHFFMAEDFGFFTKVYYEPYPKSVPPIISLFYLILADIDRYPEKS